MKILIVDDEEIQRRKLARLISESSISFLIFYVHQMFREQ